MYMFLRAMIHVQNELRVDAAGSRWVDVNFTIFMQLSGKVRHYDFCYFHFFYCINLFYLFVDVCCIFCDFIGCCGCPGCHCGYCGCGWRPRPRPRRRCCRYNIYVYYIYISVCACMNISGKMNIKHHIDMILIFKEYQTFMILITFFFKKLSSDFAYFAGRSGLERKGPSFRCGRCRSLGALTARRLEVKDPRQSKRRRWFWCKRWNMGKDGETLNRKIS